MKYKRHLLQITLFTLLISLITNKAFAETTTKNKLTAEATAKKYSYRASIEVPAMRNRVYTQLARAQQLADEGDKIEGFEVLDQVHDRLDSLNSYERAMLFNFYGFMYYSNDDVALALESFTKVIAEQAIPNSLLVSTHYSLAQLTLQQQDYKEALRYLMRWRELNGKPLSANQEMLFAQVYYQDKDFVNTLMHIDNATRSVATKDQLPKESWLILQRATYYELRQPRKVTQVMETLVRLYDKPQYWLQLSSMYGEIGEENKQMAVMEAAYQAGYVSKAIDIITLSQLYLFHGAPVKAANILAQAIEQGDVDPIESHLDLLSRAYLSAKEDDKAIEVLKQLSQLSDKAVQGKYDALLAQTYLHNERWPLAITHADKAISKASQSAENVESYLGNMYLAKGMAYVNLKNFKQSLSAFAQAVEQVNTQKTAQQWTQYVQREQENYHQQKRLVQGLLN